VRADNRATRATLLEGIERIAHGIARAHGVPEDRLPEVIPSATETTPPTHNDEPTAQRIEAALREHMGAAAVVPYVREGMGAEDFAYYGAPEHGVKSVFFFVGGTPRAELASAASHHSPLFKIAPEPAVKTGIEAMVTGALALLTAR
jgi:hippurate hydrolase